MANIITGIRIAASAALLFCPALSPAFYVLYLVAGLSDAADGFVARKTSTVTAFGAKLDTVADGIFAAVCLYKLLPVLAVPGWLLGWIAGIAVIKAVNVLSGYVMRGQFVAVHSLLNKATGVLLFLIPLTFTWIEWRYSSAAACAVATIAAVQEGHLIRTGRQT